jgi:TonB family protein
MGAFGMLSILGHFLAGLALLVLVPKDNQVQPRYSIITLSLATKEAHHVLSPPKEAYRNRPPIPMQPKREKINSVEVLSFAPSLAHAEDKKITDVEAISTFSVEDPLLVKSEMPSGMIRPSPQLINKDEVKVPYPERARQLMIEGIVHLRFTVSEAGRVIDAKILSGPYHGLRNAALLVAKRLFFLPATDERGQAKTAQIDHEVIFKLTKRS